MFPFVFHVSQIYFFIIFLKEAFPYYVSYYHFKLQNTFPADLQSMDGRKLPSNNGVSFYWLFRFIVAIRINKAAFAHTPNKKL